MGSGSITSRAAIPAPIRRHGVFRRAAEIRACALRRLRHGASAPGARSTNDPGLAGAASRPTPTPSPSSPRRGIIMCASRSARRWKKISTRSRSRSRRRARAGARSFSIASISSTASRPIQAYALRVRRGRLRGRRALDRALRHQWRHAAARSRAHRRRPCKAACPAASSASTRITTPKTAVANSLAAVRAGARQIQGTLNGLGERCGNANLTSLIPTLLLKPDFAERLRDRRARWRSWRASPRSATRSMNCSIARRTAMRPMSAPRPSPPRPASMPPP